MFKNKAILFLLLVLSTLYLRADTTDVWQAEQVYVSPQEQHYFDENKWEELISDLEYKEEIERPKEEKEEKVDKDFGINFGFWSQFFKVFAIIAGIVLVAFLIYFLINSDLSNPRSKKISGLGKDFNIEEIEENLQTADVDDFIQRAINDKAFTLAVRLYYLKAIKDLSENKYIVWKKDKTNRTYMNELSGQHLEQEFKAITPIFERVWYGSKTLTEGDFYQLQPKFQHFINSIKAPTDYASE